MNINNTHTCIVNKSTWKHLKRISFPIYQLVYWHLTESHAVIYHTYHYQLRKILFFLLLYKYCLKISQCMRSVRFCYIPLKWFTEKIQRTNSKSGLLEGGGNTFIPSFFKPPSLANTCKVLENKSLDLPLRLSKVRTWL